MKWLVRVSIIIAVLGLGVVIYVKMHPLVFNESFFQHAHCMAQADMALLIWAHEHGGQFPTHTNGYGDVLLLVWNEAGSPQILTGPGYSPDPIRRAHDKQTHLAEAECGRVYVQGLHDDTDRRIVILFDKLSTPGDHTHFFGRMWSPLGREVGFVDGSHGFISDDHWPSFAKEQIDLLVRAGFDRKEAERLYAERGTSSRK
jgi:hypothetical protein